MGKRHHIWNAAALAAVLATGAWAEAPKLALDPSGMTVVQNVDLARYAGLWYEIARFPASFEKNCVGVTAEYTPRTDGKVDVLNTCRKGSLDAAPRTAKAVATVVGPGKLSVNFVPWLPFIAGNYWVLHLEPDYSLAVVGGPDRKYGWILSRTKEADPKALARAMQVLTDNGYDMTRLEQVAQ